MQPPVKCELDAPSRVPSRTLKYPMSTTSDPCSQHEEIFKQSAAELEADADDLQGTHGNPVTALSGMARLRAENEALRNQVVSLETQWEFLRTTLGVSTTICSRDSI